MFDTWVKSLGTAGVVGILLIGSAADGRTVNLVDGSGNAVGWQATIADGGDLDSINLSFVRSENGVYFFNKSATVTSNNSALVIEFVRTSASAPTLAIGTESITNSSGSDWTGFRTFVSTATATGGSGAGFQLSADPAGFNISPFTNMSFTNNNTEMVVTGGTVANGSVYSPGSSTSGGIVIMSANSADDRFLLKEIGLTGGGSGPGPVIPVPAAVWTGMSMLGGLAVIKRVRRA